MNHFDDWSPEIIESIKRTCVPSGELPPDHVFQLFLYTCRKTGLDPILKEIFLQKRRSKVKGSNPPRFVDSWQTMVSRDGYLAAAHRTGELRGIQTTVFPDDVSKPPTHARCLVWRKGWEHPVDITVAFQEYVERYSDGNPIGMWANPPQGKPRTMIGKVAESQALRRAFSYHGTYSEDELPQSEAAGQVSESPSAHALSPAEAPAPALPAPAFKDVLGSKLAAARSKPWPDKVVGVTSAGKLIVHVLPTHDEDGLPVHPMGDDEPPDEPEGPPSPMPIERQIKEDKGAAIHDIMAELQRVLPPLVGEARKSGDARTIYQGHFFDLAHECFGIELRVMGEFSDRLATLPLMQLVDGLEKLRQLEVRS